MGWGGGWEDRLHQGRGGEERWWWGSWRILCVRGGDGEEMGWGGEMGIYNASGEGI